MQVTYNYCTEEQCWTYTIQTDKHTHRRDFDDQILCRCSRIVYLGDKTAKFL